MGEINFFAPYILKEQKKQKIRNRIQAGILIVLLIAGGVSGFLFLTDQKMKAEIRATEAYLAKPEILEKIERMESMKLRMEVGAQYLDELKDLEARIDTVDFINVKLMDTLASTLPSGCAFTDMKLDVNNLSLTGTAVTNRNVAEIEYNLMKTGLFNEVNVSKITNENNTRQFVLNAIFR